MSYYTKPQNQTNHVAEYIKTLRQEDPTSPIVQILQKDPTNAAALVAFIDDISVDFSDYLEDNQKVESILSSFSELFKLSDKSSQFQLLLLIKAVFVRIRAFGSLPVVAQSGKDHKYSCGDSTSFLHFHHLHNSLVSTLSLNDVEQLISFEDTPNKEFFINEFNRKLEHKRDCVSRCNQVIYLMNKIHEIESSEDFLHRAKQIRKQFKSNKVLLNLYDALMDAIEFVTPFPIYSQNGKLPKSEDRHTTKLAYKEFLKLNRVQHELKQRKIYILNARDRKLSRGLPIFPQGAAFSMPTVNMGVDDSVGKHVKDLKESIHSTMHSIADRLPKIEDLKEGASSVSAMLITEFLKKLGPLMLIGLGLFFFYQAVTCKFENKEINKNLGILTAILAGASLCIGMFPNGIKQVIASIFERLHPIMQGAPSWVLALYNPFIKVINTVFGTHIASPEKQSDYIKIKREKLMELVEETKRDIAEQKERTIHEDSSEWERKMNANTSQIFTLEELESYYKEQNEILDKEELDPDVTNLDPVIDVMPGADVFAHSFMDIFDKFYGCIDTLVMAFLGYTFCKEFSIKNLTHGVKTCGVWSRNKMGVREFLEGLIKSIATCINWIIEKITGHKDIIPIKKTYPIIQEWTKEVELLKTESLTANKLKVNTENAQRIFKLICQGNQMSVTRLGNLYDRGIRDVIIDNQNILRTLFLPFEAANLDGSGPKSPCWILYLKGESGGGKSSIVLLIITEVLLRILPPEERPKCRKNLKDYIYNRQNEHEYRDGYRGQIAMIMDEYGMVRDQIGNKESENMEILREGNIMPNICHMADLGSKGNTYSNVKLLVITTNEKDVQTASISHPNAVRRRLDMPLLVVANPEMSMPLDPTVPNPVNTLDPHHPDLVDNPLNTNASLFYLCGKYTGLPPDMSNVYKFEDVVDMAVAGIKNREERFAKYMDAVHLRMDETIEELESFDCELVEPDPVVAEYGEDAVPEPTLEEELEDLEIVTQQSPFMLRWKYFCDKFKHLLYDDILDVYFTNLVQFDCKTLYQTINVDGYSWAWFMFRFHEKSINFFEKISVDTVTFITELKKTYKTSSMARIIESMRNFNPDWIHEYKPIKQLTLNAQEVYQTYYTKVKEAHPILFKLGEVMTILSLGVGIYAGAQAIFSKPITAHGSGDKSRTQVHKLVKSHKLNRPKPIKAQGPHTDKNALDIAMKVENNMYSMEIQEAETGKRFRQGYATVLKGRILMVNGHYQDLYREHVKRNLKSPDDAIFFSNNKTKYQFELPLSYILDANIEASFPDSDIMLVHCDITVKMHPDITSLFVNEEVFKLKNLKSFLLIPGDTGDKENYRSTYFMPSKTTTGVKMRMESGSAVLSKCLMYNFASKFGDCGSILFVDDVGISPGKILGIHSAGNNYNMGYSTFTSKELILSALDRYERSVEAYRYDSVAYQLGNEDQMIIEPPGSNANVRMIEVDPNFNDRVNFGSLKDEPVDAVDKTGQVIRQGPVPIEGPFELNFLPQFDFVPQIANRIQEVVDPPSPTFNLSLVSEVPQGNFKFIRFLDKYHRTPSRSQIVKSPLYGIFGPPTRKPVKLYDEKNPGRDMRLDSVKKFGKILPELDQALVDACVQHTFAQIEADSDPNTLEDYMIVLTTEEAIKGCPHLPYIDSLNRSTSPGWPYINEVHKGYKGKEYWLGKDGSFKGPGYEELIKDVKRLENAYQDDLPVEVIFTDNHKDELRKPGKLPRLFSGTPQDYLVVCKKYYGGFMGWVVRNRVKNGICIGINPYSHEWDVLHRTLRKLGNKVIAGDFIGFDSSMSAQILMAILTAIDKWYRYENNSLRSSVRRGAAKDLVYSKHILGNVLYQWLATLPSGHLLTSILGSIYNLVSGRIVYVIAHGYDIPCLLHFSEDVILLVFSDDHIMNISDEVSEYFNQHTLPELYEKIGMGYTDELKTDGTNIPKFRTLSEVTFLKRTFRWEPVLNRFVAPLCLQVILEMLYWSKKGMYCETIPHENCDFALRELSLHDKATYDNIMPLLCSEAISKINHFFPIIDYYVMQKIVSEMEDFY